MRTNIFKQSEMIANTALRNRALVCEWSETDGNHVAIMIAIVIAIWQLGSAPDSGCPCLRLTTWIGTNRS